MKSTVAEVVVPAVLRLYSRLAPSGGQVPAYLVRIANDLLNDYRQEVTNITSMCFLTAKLANNTIFVRIKNKSNNVSEKSNQ